MRRLALEEGGVGGGSGEAMFGKERVRNIV